MSLDKQRILNELGSVMNQLQSADCGCMGKLFNGGQGGGCGGPMGNPLPTCGGCRRGCCPGHGYGVHNANMTGSGEPFPMNAGGMAGGGMFPGKMHGGMHGGMHGMQEGMHGGMHEGMHSGMHEGMHGGTHEGMHGGMHEGMHGGMHEGMQGGFDGMPREMHNGLQPAMGGGMGAGMRNGLDGGMGGGMGMSGGMGMGGGMAMGGGMKSNDMPFGGMKCMMGRNAPKLYADTYNYLNKNMMQPTMQEVYNDLKSITPENTIASNPLAKQMGLSAPGGAPMNASGMGGQMTPGMEMTGNPGNPMTSHNTPQLSGMGANIVNMMMSGGGGRPTNPPQGGQLNDAMLIDAPHSPHGQVGITPLTAQGNMGMNAGGMPGGGMNPAFAQGQPDNNMGGMPAMGQSNPATMMHNPTTQYVTQDNMHEANAMPLQGSMMPQTQAMPMQGNNMTQGNGMLQGNAIPQSNANSQSNAMTRNMPGMNMGQNPYGKHTAGIKKFNEMFPGVMQGDLNFDPMAIAVQMNPANQKQAAMDTMTKLMNGNKGQAMLQPAVAGANAAIQQLSQGGQQQMTVPGTTMQPNQQQVYTANTGAPNMNQQMLQQQVPQQQIQGQEYHQGQMQQQVDPNTGAVITPGYEGTEVDPNAPPETVPVADQGMNKEPIYPVQNTTAYNMAPQYNGVQYNTLGQPVNFVPGDSYHKAIPGLPQTLGGTFRPDLQQGYGVKNTMSKTAIAGTIPVGATASRSQLKHIYRQYKASHSATQQNIRPPPVMQANSPSAGNLNTTPMNAAPMSAAAATPMQQIPVEKVGGDSMANNQVDYIQPKMEQGMGQVGDGPITQNPTHGDTLQEKSGGGGGGMLGKGRNGLQDIAYTAYRGSAAWSFHG